MDEDLLPMSRGELLAQVVILRAMIRKHRDAKGHDLCWFWPELWSLLPEKEMPNPEPPPWPEFMQKCATYRASLDKRRLPLFRRNVGDGSE
jgi:hypothetical protein